VVLTAACVAARDAGNDRRARRFDRHHLPGFDPYVYVAMAEDPAFFTVAPWGYRVLSPLAVHALWPGDEVRGFRRLSVLGLAVTGPLLYLFLRRTGGSEALSLVATGLFFFSPPADEAFRNWFLAEPVTLPLFLAALLALEARRAPVAAAALFAAATALGALAKDVVVVLLPGLVAAALALHGLRGGLRRVAPGVAAALAVHFGLRQAWAPYPSLSEPPSGAQLAAALHRIAGAAGDWWAPLFACGFPLAVVGLFAPGRGRDLGRRYGVLLALSLALPFAAAVYTGSAAPAEHFYTDDVPRLLAYAVPVFFALALAALAALRVRLPTPAGSPLATPATRDSSDAAGDPDADPQRPWPLVRWAVAAASILLAIGAAAVPFVVLDPYRRADLRGRTDGPFILAFSRDSLAFARRLAAGKPVLYEPKGRRFRAGRSDARHMERMRWFLREGWGERPEYGMEDVTMRGSRADIVLPVLEPRALVLAFELRAPQQVPLRVAVNGRPLGEIRAAPQPERQRLEVPEAALFRGDNRLTLEHAQGSSAGTPVSLAVLNVRAADPP
jgi:hypothetical protein